MLIQPKFLRPGLVPALLAIGCLQAHAQYIDPNLKPSIPTITPISQVDTNLTEYNRFVLTVGDDPFFYNGIQLRADKLKDVYFYTEPDIKALYQLAAEDGFTVVNTQITWLDVQPDTSINASESTYIRGGSFANENFASSTSNILGHSPNNESYSELVYVKFDFPAYSGSVDAAKIRFYVDSALVDSLAFPATLYGITNNSWSASAVTWSSAPNSHNGNITGTLGVDYFIASTSPSWDPITSQTYYDFDATEFIRDHCPEKIASFVLTAANSGTGTVGASVSGAKGTHPPSLILSDENNFDWTYLETLLGWAEAAGIKLELIWFGSDSTGVTMDSRVAYFSMTNIKNEEVNSDGSHTPVFAKNTDPAYGVYWYFLDKNDLTTRSQEKRAIKEMMNQVASWNEANGNSKVVVGVDIANEPAIQKFHGSSFTAWHNPATWAALSNFSSVQNFVDRTMWEFCVNLANGVKESNYPVWTRSNDFNGVDAAHASYNEAQRETVGTSVDFVGLDPYSNGFTDAFLFGHAVSWDNKKYATGKTYQ